MKYVSLTDNSSVRSVPRPRLARLARSAMRLGGAAIAVSILAAHAPHALTDLLLPTTLGAQVTTGSIRGFVRTASGAPVVAAQVSARLTTTNQLRGTTTNESGGYTLGGLRPGTYELAVRRIGFAPVTRLVVVQVGQTVDGDISIGEAAARLGTVTVVAEAASAERRTSEVATNVTQAQINQLPSPSRNILDLAALAPGVRVDPDRINGTSKTFSVGAQPAANINVFVDGASYKNDIVVGGVAGQQDSRGNPFPRNAVQEFRITTANFKAEYQKASSGIISAVTKSGTNEWTGNAFADVQNQTFVALDTFQLRSRFVAESIGRATNAPSAYSTPEYKRYLVGLGGGGPLIKDKLFVYGSYEGNYQDRQGRFQLQGNTAQLPASVLAQNGQVNVSPFRSNLLFGKLSYNQSSRQLIEVSGDFRHETDIRRFGGQFGDVQRSYSAGENFRNTVATGRVKQTLYGAESVNELQLSHQYYQYNPEPLDFTTVGVIYDGNNRLGGADTRQDLKQGRTSLRDDYAYTGFKKAGEHVIKVGGNYDYVTYDMNKQLNENPFFTFSNSNNNAFPIAAEIGYGNPSLKTNNSQVGLYAQDDWTPTPRLTINAGVRWDYESKMFNTSYVTPKNVRDSIVAYQDSLILKFNVNNYLTDGTQRKNFYGAIQPRLGFSYIVDQAQRTTVFGGVGIFYDRQVYNSLLDESFNLQHPNYFFKFGAVADPANGVLAWDPKYFSRQGLINAIASGQAPPIEVFLLPNDLKPPKSTQYNLGLRHDFGGFSAALTYTGTRSYNGLSFEWANFGLDSLGGCCTNKNVPAYRNVLVANNSVHSWYNAMYLQLDKPYVKVEDRASWGAGLAYTLAKAESEGVDLFSFPRLSAFGFSRYEIPNSERHRVVANGIVDLPWAWGIQASTLVTLGSGNRFAAQDFSGPQPVFNRGGAEPQKFSFILSNFWAYRNVDTRLRKDLVPLRGQKLGVTMDVFNLFNFNNFGCFNDVAFTNNNGVRTANPSFGNPGCTISDPRRLQLGAVVDF